MNVKQEQEMAAIERKAAESIKEVVDRRTIAAVLERVTSKEEAVKSAAQERV